MRKILNTDNVIDFLYESKPKKVWECSKEIEQEIRMMRDGEGQYLWQEVETVTSYNTAEFWGIPIYCSKNFEGLALKFIFGDGYEKRIIFNGDSSLGEPVGIL